MHSCRVTPPPPSPRLRSVQRWVFCAPALQRGACSTVTVRVARSRPFCVRELHSERIGRVQPRDFALFCLVVCFMRRVLTCTYIRTVRALQSRSSSHTRAVHVCSCPSLPSIDLQTECGSNPHPPLTPHHRAPAPPWRGAPPPPLWDRSAATAPGRRHCRRSRRVRRR